MVISSGFTFPWRERPAILPSMMMALGDCTMSLKVTVAASIRAFISLFTASLISAMRACVAKRSQRLTKRMAVCSSGTGAPPGPTRLPSASGRPSGAAGGRVGRCEPGQFFPPCRPCRHFLVLLALGALIELLHESVVNHVVARADLIGDARVGLEQHTHHHVVRILGVDLLHLLGTTGGHLHLRRDPRDRRAAAHAPSGQLVGRRKRQREQDQRTHATMHYLAEDGRRSSKIWRQEGAPRG